MAKKLAQTIVGLNIVIWLVAQILSFRFNLPRLGAGEVWPWSYLALFFHAIVYTVLAVLVLSRHPRHTVGWLFLIVGFAAVLAQLAAGSTAMALALPIHSETVRALITLLTHLVWVPWLLIPLSLVLQFFPNGRLLSPRWWLVTVVTLLAMLGMELGQTFTPWNQEMQSVLILQL